MRTFMKLLAAMLAISLSGVLMSSCKKEEPTPEIVENPLESGYFISGSVTDGTNGIDGVTVSINEKNTTTDKDGTFLLSVDEVGDYTVSFSKTGYISVTSIAEIPSGTLKGSVTSLLQDLTAKNPPVSINPNEAAVIGDNNNSSYSLAIPAGAVTTTTDVSVTPFKPGQGSLKNNASLVTLNCDPDGLTFAKAVSVEIANPGSSAIQFSGMTHLVEKNGSWEAEGEAVFDKEKNAYISELNGFSNHTFGAQCQIVKGGTSTEDLGSKEVDNLGNMSSVTSEISTTQRTGWRIDGDISAQLKSSFPALSDADISALAANITSAIASTKGSSPGVRETTLSLGTSIVSGDTKMTVQFLATVELSTVSFSLLYQGAPANVSFSLTTYKGIATQITYEFGENRTDHSGGAVS